MRFTQWVMIKWTLMQQKKRLMKQKLSKSKTLTFYDVASSLGLTFDFRRLKSPKGDDLMAVVLQERDGSLSLLFTEQVTPKEAYVVTSILLTKLAAHTLTFNEEGVACFRGSKLSLLDRRWYNLSRAFVGGSPALLNTSGLGFTFSEIANESYEQALKNQIKTHLELLHYASVLTT